MKTTRRELDRLLQRARQAPCGGDLSMPPGFAARVLSQSFAESRGGIEAFYRSGIRWSIVGAVVLMLVSVLLNLSVLAKAPLNPDLAVRQAMAQLVFDR